MKRIALSTIAVAALCGTINAATITLYQDTTTGAIYTKPGANRVKLGDFVDAKELKKMKTDETAQIKNDLGVKVKSGVPLLKFSGTHYLGYRYTKKDNGPNTSQFETRRNYFEVKGYWNDTDYVRLTLDTFQAHTASDSNIEGSWEVRLKYAYLYLNLDKWLPYTGVEMGQVHRPWIDYAEHHGWLYRAVSETFVETSHGAHTINSAAPGVNFKTNSDYFTGEVGFFNNGGYHSIQKGTGQSFEWRLTANLLGNGRKHVHATKDKWLNVSFFGRYLTGSENGLRKDTLTGIHAVYNQPLFLIGGYYLNNDSETTNHIDSKKDGNGWSVNGELRPIDKWAVFGRYDNWKVKGDSKSTHFDDYTRENIIGGVAYTYNKHVRFIFNGIWFDPDDKVGNDKTADYMATAEVKW